MASMMNDIEGFLTDNPKYVEICEHLLKYERETELQDRYEHHVEDTDYDNCWDSSDVKVKPQTLYQIEMGGVIDRVFDTNSSTIYAITDQDELEQALNNVGTTDGIREDMHEFPSEDDLPDDLFADVVGYDKIKWLLRRGLTTDEITNFLLVGPTGSAKTVFLMSIEEHLEGAEFTSGSPTSGPGVLDVMFKRNPKYMLIDELDDMDGDTQKVLTQYTETGIVDETKVGKDRKLKTNTKTFASANNASSIIEQMRDRFTDLHFEPYTRDEYIEVCTHILPRKENTSEEEAEVIAKEVWKMEDSGDVRKAIQVARLSRGDPKKVISVLDEYSEKGLAKRL